MLGICLLTLPWMVRNAVEVGHFGISGRDGELLAIRAEYGRLTWAEIGGAFAYWLPIQSHLPGHSRLLAAVHDRLEPAGLGFARLDRFNPDSFYVHAKWMTGEVANRAQAHDPAWLSSQSRCDAQLKQAAGELIRENWLKQAALTLAFAIRGTGALYAGVLAILVVPAAFVVLALAAWKRRDLALTLLMLPALYGFGIHAAATHFIPRYGRPLIPVALVVCALAGRILVDKCMDRASE